MASLDSSTKPSKRFPLQAGSQPGAQQVLAIKELTLPFNLASHQAGIQCMSRGQCYCHLAKGIQLSFTKRTTLLTSGRKASNPAEKMRKDSL